MSLGSILLGGLSGLISGIAGGPVGMAMGAATGAGSAAAADSMKPGAPKKQLDLSPIVNGEMPGMQFEKKPEEQNDLAPAMTGLVGSIGNAAVGASKNIGNAPPPGPPPSGAPGLNAPVGQPPLAGAGQSPGQNNIFMSYADKLARQRRGY